MQQEVDRSFPLLAARNGGAEMNGASALCVTAVIFFFVKAKCLGGVDRLMELQGFDGKSAGFIRR